MAIFKCGYCRARTSDSTGSCENCGHEIDSTFAWLGGPTTPAKDRAIAADVGPDSSEPRSKGLPGETAYTVLKVVAAVELVFTLPGSAVIATEFQTTIGWGIAVAVAVQGVITSALLFAFAALGQNLIAVRRHLEREEGAHTALPKTAVQEETATHGA